MHPELVPKKNGFSKQVNRLQTVFSRLVNPLLLPLRFGYVFREGKWGFHRVRMKPKKQRHTYEDGTPRWDMAGASLLPLDENAQRRLIEITSGAKPSTRGNKKNREEPGRFLKKGLSPTDLFRQLNELKVRYAVLRGFDGLPDQVSDTGLALLFGDEAMDKIASFFDKQGGAGSTACQVYSSSGLLGSDLKGLPYYEQRLADEILANTRLHNDLVCVPDQRTYLKSLAYHAVYHKAGNSGLPFESGQQVKSSDDGFDYAAEFTRLAKELDMTVEPTLSGLNDLLKSADWEPQLDTVRKLSESRPVLNGFLEEPSNTALGLYPEPQLGVFLVREWGAQRHLVPWVAANLRHYGFDIKWVHEFTEEERERARMRIRGGNWSAGPYPVSGGEPWAIIVVCDYAPEPPDADLLRKKPFTGNARIIMMKNLLRDAVNAHLPSHMKVNPVHSADDEQEAWDYLRAASPQKANAITRRIAEGYRGDPNVRLMLNRGKRAATYLVYRDGRPCVLKVFSDHPDGHAALKAEKLASETFSGRPWASAWLEFGPTWMLQEFYNPATRLDVLSASMSPEDRLALAGRVIATIREIHAAGFAHRDLHAENFFVSGEDLRIIDFETLMEQDASIPFEQSYDITAKGLDSPAASGKMCFTNTKNPRSLSRVLGVSLADALKEEADLKPGRKT